MNRNNYQDLNSETTGNTIPKVNIFTMLRLGLFNLGIGLISVLTLAVLNRVMISELGIPATIAAGTLALSQLVAPTRIWLGQLSDSKKLFGLHRTGYVRLGIMMAGLCIFLAVQIVWLLGKNIEINNGWQWNVSTVILSLGLALIFILQGIAIGASSTPFTALLVDISDEDNRSKIVGIIWSMLMVGIVIGGVIGQVLLKNLAVEEDNTISLSTLQPPINSIFIIVPLIVIFLTFIATWGVEKKYSRYRLRSSFVDREDGISLKRALKILTSSRQTGIFFSFLVMITMSLFMQEAVLEPYGGEIFKMSIGETTMLNSFWGIGILIGYGTTGFFVIPRLGKTKTTKIGCILVALSFSLIILSGLTTTPQILQGSMVLFGIAAGITTIGSISLMLDLTIAETAGTFIGAWGLAQSMSRGIAIAIGGWILDVARFMFNNAWFAYSFVFFCEALFIIGAIALLNKVNVQEFQNTTRQATAMVMEAELD
ncbi:MAG: BCD family MFS transporter [Cyanobacteria bacterium]|nr:BCD family MFS transporter [Cyanobacteria bacterium CG_2015-16_32_12]NCO78933.1 BCD family MFS transporter [Cyanobacteria bacterium CG_2015-22_32_23]NCQ04954.1 BCD family MFS transporter [Cyanobacteria bacterium CG_2015-09_32_10]NCQ42717.1 BCD family MFS transporter [Cyanobacteria bacterium CG_2015-04_32_10]NCS83806.1 BCD family MFS transporter [Cyanobacteria bacterium CG_2015-02_32_10]